MPDGTPSGVEVLKDRATTVLQENGESRESNIAFLSGVLDAYFVHTNGHLWSNQIPIIETRTPGVEGQSGSNVTFIPDYINPGKAVILIKDNQTPIRSAVVNIETTPTEVTPHNIDKFAIVAGNGMSIMEAYTRLAGNAILLAGVAEQNRYSKK